MIDLIVGFVSFCNKKFAKSAILNRVFLRINVTKSLVLAAECDNGDVEGFQK